MNAPLRIKPFAFDRVFASAALADDPAADPAARMDDLEQEFAAQRSVIGRMERDHVAALALARADGFEAGLAQARTERDAALLAAVDSLQASIEAVDEELADIARRTTEDATTVALVAADLLAARALVHAPGAAIDEAIGRVLKQVARGQELQLYVHPDLVGEIERLVARRQAGDRRKLNLHVMADPALIIGDARIEWEQGSLCLDAAARADAIHAELNNLLPIPLQQR